MKKYLVILVSTSLLATAVFGFWLVACGGLGCGHDNAHKFVCIASKISAASCPEESNALAFVNFHIDGLKTVSASALGNVLLAWSLFVALAVLAQAAALSGKAARIFNTPIFASYRRLKTLSILSSLRLRREIASWLAGRENSPALA